jgi:hypothetical protein
LSGEQRRILLNRGYFTWRRRDGGIVVSISLKASFHFEWFQGEGRKLVTRTHVTVEGREEAVLSLYLSLFLTATVAKTIPQSESACSSQM